MNCECVYIIKNGTEADYDKFAKGVRAVSELYPVTYAEVLVDTIATKDYDGNSRKKIIKAGTKLIFVYGKYFYMCDRGIAKVWFPQDRNTNWFKDLKEYE